MKKIIAVLMVAVLAFGVSACGNGESKKGSADGNKEPLIVGLEAGFPPYEYIGADGKVEGIDVDITQKIADKMGRKLEIKDMDFDGALLAVQSGKVDLAASGISVTKDREKQMDFSTRYVDSTEVVVINPKSPALKAATWKELNGKIIAVQQGNIADIQVSNPQNVKPKEIKRYTKFVQAAEDLKNNKVDCIVMDQKPAEELVKASKDTLQIVAGDPLFVDQYAIAVKKGNKELLDEVNAVIKSLKDSGELQKIIEKHSKK